MDKTAELGKSSLFKSFPQNELTKLAQIAQEHSFNAGDKVIGQGDPSDELMIIVLGSVQVSRRLDSGEEEKIAVLGSGSYFGEAAAIFVDTPRAVTVEALEKSFVLGFKHDRLTNACDNDPELGYHVYRAIAEASLKRGRSLVNEVAYFKSLTLHH